MLIEQAIFASARTERTAGYQLVGRSLGVTESEARELTAWGPSHDSLLDSGQDAVSYNFHPLYSGRYCVSRSSAAGMEYSARGGARVYTQCLIVSGDTLARFANNPFALLEAAAASGVLEVFDEVPTVLEPFRLGGRSAVVDHSLILKHTHECGPEALSAAVAAVLSHEQVALVGQGRAEEFIAAVVNCLPLNDRLQLSFSTGLKLSSRRPFRLVWLGPDICERRKFARQECGCVVDLARLSESAPAAGWAGFVANMLAARDITRLAGEIVRQHESTNCKTTAPVQKASAVPMQAPPEERIVERPAAREKPLQESLAKSESIVKPEPMQRADSAHARFCAQLAAAAQQIASVETKPAELLRPQSPEVMELLEHLDDLVFAAIKGNHSALLQLEVLWPIALGEIDRDLVEESREQYLRYALSIWDDGEPTREPERAAAALDVLCMLFDES